LEEAEYLADNIAILHEGRIIAEGTPQHLKTIMPQRGARLDFQNEADAEKAMALLKENGIFIDSVTQNLPSLEDVFLTLIGEKKESNHNE
jgi:ABC-2 type transport system ATP-binding protein